MATDSINAPKLLSPNGGEIFTEGDISISWIEPTNIPSTELIWYEIFIIDDFEKIKKSELLQIATLPSGNTSYSYTIHKNLRGAKSRIGIRAVNNKGFRSKISFSADDFTIINEFLPSPALMSPVKGDSYFSYVPFIFDHNSIIGRSSQRSFYQIYYKSDNQNIDWTLLQGNIMIGTDPVNIDVSNFNTDSDYIFKIELVDGDSISAPVFIDDISIKNINLFIIDTTPPTGTVKIVDNKEYTNDKSLILKIESSDSSTESKEVQIQQTNVESQEVALGNFVTLTPLMTWDIKPEGDSTEVVDGVKLIQARYRDFGNKTIEDIVSDNYFRTYKNINNRSVSIIFNNGEDLYSAFVGDDILNISPQLYKNLTLLSTLEGEATSLEFYKSTLYVAIKDDENKGILQRFTGGSISTIVNNDSQFLDSSQTILNSLFTADSVINAMEVFDNTLFLGLDNGELLSFKGVSITSENSSNLNIKSINNLKTDGNLLYIFFNNTTEILIMNKNSNGDYVFDTVDTENK